MSQLAKGEGHQEEHGFVEPQDEVDLLVSLRPP